MNIKKNTFSVNVQILISGLNFDTSEISVKEPGVKLAKKFLCTRGRLELILYQFFRIEINP